MPFVPEAVAPRNRSQHAGQQQRSRSGAHALFKRGDLDGESNEHSRLRRLEDSTAQGSDPLSVMPRAPTQREIVAAVTGKGCGRFFVDAGCIDGIGLNRTAKKMQKNGTAWEAIA